MAKRWPPARHRRPENEIRRHYFNASTSYGPLGYDLPAALEAQLGQPDLPVIALVGDGGVVFTLSELATAVEARLPLIILLLHNQGYEEIRRYMDNHDIKRLGAPQVYRWSFVASRQSW